MIEETKNGVSHPKKDLLKKMNPPKKFQKQIFFFFKLNKYNDRKTKKWGKSPKKRLNKKITPPEKFQKQIFFSSN